MALRKWFPLLVVSQRVVGLGSFPHGWAGYAPKAGALPTALHPDMKLGENLFLLVFQLIAELRLPYK